MAFGGGPAQAPPTGFPAQSPQPSPAAAPPSPQPPSGSAQPGGDPGVLHDHALQAEQHLEKLATGLAQAGADQGTVDAVGKMADVTRKIVSALGKGQEQTGDNQPPAAAPPPSQAPAPQHQVPPPARSQPPQATPAQHTFASATAQLHADALAKANQRR